MRNPAVDLRNTGAVVSIRWEADSGFYRETREPGASLDDLSQEAQDQIIAHWTPERVAAWQREKDEANQPPPAIDWNEVDQQTINRALAEPGSIVRALGIITFEEINKLRVRASLPAYTLEQFKTALFSKIRDQV